MPVPTTFTKLSALTAKVAAFTDADLMQIVSGGTSFKVALAVLANALSPRLGDVLLTSVRFRDGPGSTEIILGAGNTFMDFHVNSSTILRLTQNSVRVDSGVAFQLGNSAVTEVIVPTKTLLIRDQDGVTYKIPALPV